jgi:C4-dicarboxylate transporter DctQ subunit
MKVLLKMSHIFDTIIDALANISAALTIFVMLIMCYEVVMRYFLNKPTLWVTEISGICVLYVTFFSAAWLLRKKRHVAMDLFLGMLRPRPKALLNVWNSIIGAFVSLYLVWYGALVTLRCLQGGYATEGLLQIPRAIILVVIPLGGFLLLVQFLREAYGYLGKHKEEED